ncbi:MAG: TonB family protein [Terriglobales bacterium]|jgi:TonB family protein
MSAAATQAPVRVFTNTRRVPRFPLAVPADVTVLRSGIPYSIPGRSVTLGERGVGLVLAGELHPGDSVGIEFRLPDAGGPFRLKAVVRYQALFHCGLEFVNLTSEQQTLIEHWTRRKSVANPTTAVPGATPATPAAIPAQSRAIPGQVISQKIAVQKRVQPMLRRAAWVALVGTFLLAAGGWWHWRQAWGELESQIPASQKPSQPPPVYVPAEAMERLLIHKIEPIYPDAARQTNIQGIVILDTVIGRDGTVIDVHPISGPDELTPAAVDAVKWWRFQPYQAQGQPVEVETKLAVEFRGD